MLKLYDYRTSGNCWKVRIMLSQLEIPYERVELDRTDGSVKKPDYLAVNPLGLVPAVAFDDGRVLADSGAIMFYLASGTPYLPEGAFERAEVIRWLAFENPYMSEGLGLARFYTHILGKPDEHAEDVAIAQAKGREGLGIMERHLDGQDYFVGGAYSVADTALHVYSSMAELGKVSLDPYPNVCAWIARVKAQPRYVELEEV